MYIQLSYAFFLLLIIELTAATIFQLSTEQEKLDKNSLKPTFRLPSATNE